MKLALTSSNGKGLMKLLTEIFTPASLLTTSFPLMVIISRKFYISWILRSISFGADLQHINTFSCSEILTSIIVSSPCKSALICVLQVLVVADCVSQLYQKYLPQSNLAPSYPDLRHEAMPLGQAAKRGSALQSYLSVLYLEYVHKSMLSVQSKILLGQLQIPGPPALLLRSSSMLCSHESASPV
jgi:hypothetical protein